MNTTPAAIAPKHTRHNGTCKTCKLSFSIMMRAGSRVYLPMALQIDLPRGFPFDSVIVDSDGNYRPAKAAGTTAYPVVECECGRRVELQPVRGKLNPSHVCNAKCTGSRGHVCECSCGGKNHGGSFSC